MHILFALHCALMAVTPMLEHCLTHFWSCKLKHHPAAHLACKQAVLASLQKVGLLPLRHHGSVPRLGPFWLLIRLMSCILE